MASHLHCDPAAPASVLQSERWLVYKKESERAFFQIFSFTSRTSDFARSSAVLSGHCMLNLSIPLFRHKSCGLCWRKCIMTFTSRRQYICTGLTACFLSSLKVMSKAREEHNRGPANPKLTSEYNLWEEHWIRWIDFPTLRFYEHLNCLFETGIVRLEFIFRFFLV